MQRLEIWEQVIGKSLAYVSMSYPLCAINDLELFKFFFSCLFVSFSLLMALFWKCHYY